MPSSIRIRSLNRSSKSFYVLLGPVFGSRQIAKEVGIHAYDDSDKSWTAAFRGTQLVGWLSVRGRVVSDCYVIPGHRRDGVMTRLLNDVVLRFQAPLRATCTKQSVGVFRKAGFVSVRKTRNYTVMELRHA